MKTPATKFFFLLTLSLIGMSAMNCDSRQHELQAKTSDPLLSLEQKLYVTEQLIEVAVEEAEKEEKSTNDNFHFPNIFDVFRSLF